MYNVPQSPFSYWRYNLRQFIRSRSSLSILIIITVGVWLTLAVTNLTVYLTSLLFNNGIRLEPFFREYLGFSASYKTALCRPWTLVTSLFVHHSFWQLLFNMLVLGMAGRIFLQYKSGKSLLVHYLVGGVCGNLMFQAAYHLFPALQHLSSTAYCLGSSAAVFAILMAVTFHHPNHPIRLMLFGQIRLKWVALIFIALMLIPLIDSDSKRLGELFSLLGGILYGIIVGLCFLKGWRMPKPKSKKEKNYYTAYQEIKPEAAPQQTDDEKRIEEILAKISKDGYGALTKEEKDFLYRYRKN